MGINYGSLLLELVVRVSCQSQLSELVVRVSYQVPLIKVDQADLIYQSWLVRVSLLELIKQGQ